MFRSCYSFLFCLGNSCFTIFIFSVQQLLLIVIIIIKQLLIIVNQQLLLNVIINIIIVVIKQLWWQPAGQRGSHQVWGDNSCIRGAAASDGKLADHERRGHLRNQAVDVPERHHQLRCLVSGRSRRREAGDSDVFPLSGISGLSV